MARPYKHGKVVKEFTRQGFTTYRLMSYGQWMYGGVDGRWKLSSTLNDLFKSDAAGAEKFLLAIGYKKLTE